MAKKKKNRIQVRQEQNQGDGRQVSASGFGSLGAALTAAGVQGMSDATEAPEVTPHPSINVTAGINAETCLEKEARLYVRMERKGRGGKTVTLLGGFVNVAAMPEVAAQIRKSMGCGARVADNHIVVQGDLRTRLNDWLDQQGASLR